MTKTKKEQMIFLDDKTILPWETPIPKGSVSMLKHFRASTKPKEFKGCATLKSTAGHYIVSASAMVYTVDLARKIKEDDEFAGPKYKTKEEVLFTGGIQIIDGMKPVSGGWVTNEKIWYAKPMLASEAVSEGLTSIIFNNELTEIGKRHRIDMIIRGYAHQKKEEEEWIKFNERIRGSDESYRRFQQRLR